MEKKKELSLEKLLKNQMWKKMNKQYLWELQRFLDLSDNIQDEYIKKILVSQMLKCDKILTQMAEEIFKKLQDENV